METEKYAALFMQANAELTKEAQEQLLQSDYVAALKTLHSIKGSALLIKDTNLVELVSQAEKAVDEEDAVTALQKLNLLAERFGVTE